MRYYCDYCDAYLTHDSASVRKQHNAGFKHKANVRNYYLQFEEHGTAGNQSVVVNGSVAAAYQVQMSQVLQQQFGRPLHHLPSSDVGPQGVSNGYAHMGKGFA